MPVTDYLQDDYLEAFEINDKDISLVSSSQLYNNEVRNYCLLTREEELRYGSYLKLYPQIQELISKRAIKGNIEPVLNLEKILASITTYEEKRYITNSLMSYYIQYGKKESQSDKIMVYYLQEYNKLTQKLGHIPTPEELTIYFSKPNKYNLFTNFTNITKIPAKELMIKIFYYIKYTIAKTTMINNNQKLVISIARKCYNLNYNNIDLSDLIAEGNIGLIKAVERFDINKKIKFSTYAYNWIKSYILKFIIEQNNSIRMPIHIYYQIKEYLEKIKKLEQKYGRPLTEQEIKDKLSISDSDFKLLAKKQIISIDGRIEGLEDGNYSLLIDAIPGSSNVEQEFKIEYFKKNIEFVLLKLNEREQTVIRKRYLSDENTIHTLEEIGQKLRLTKERIRQIEKEALKKLRYSQYVIK